LAGAIATLRFLDARRQSTEQRRSAAHLFEFSQNVKLVLAKWCRVRRRMPANVGASTWNAAGGRDYLSAHELSSSDAASDRLDVEPMLLLQDGPTLIAGSIYYPAHRSFPVQITTFAACSRAFIAAMFEQPNRKIHGVAV
jgi:hypothetical protein